MLTRLQLRVCARWSWGPLAILMWIAAAPNTHGYTLREPCTSSHDCPRGAFCRHHLTFRGQCVVLPKTPFGPVGPRQPEFPPESEPLDQASGSTPILRCSDFKPCTAGFVCRTTGNSMLQIKLCVPDSQPCWSTDDCAPEDFCDKRNGDLDLNGYCRLRQDDENKVGSP